MWRIDSKSYSLVCHYLSQSEGGAFAVGDAPEPIGGDARGHVVVCRVEDEVDVVVAVLVEGVVDLTSSADL